MSGGAIKLTTLLYYLPNDQCVQAIGVAPDIIVKPKSVPAHELKWVEELYGKEIALSNHITRNEVEGTVPPPAAPPATKPTEAKTAQELELQFLKAITDDYVVQTALTLINVWHLGTLAIPQELARHTDALRFLKKNVVTEQFESTDLM